MPRGVHIPGIEVEAELGHGAYSYVYRARKGAVQVALKVPRERGRWTRWMYREAVALARVRDSGLPAVFEVGEHDGLPYILMELVEGETLADKLARSPFDESSARELAMSLAATLASVHEAGLVHRDVKPRNIIMQHDGRVRLVDFGFATPMEPRGGYHESAGTRGYAAPEQFVAPARIDARTDLYALGRVLMTTMVGGLEAHPAAGSPDGTPPSGPGLVRLRGSVAVDAVSQMQNAGASRAFAEVVGHLVEADPAKRYPSARALLGDLALSRAGRPPQGPAAYGPPRRASPFVARDAELVKLLRSWNDLESGRGSVVLVRGPRGSGKTRLIDAATTKARDEGVGLVIDVACSEGDPPLATLRRILEAYVDWTKRLPAHERAVFVDALRAAAADYLEPFAMLIAPGLFELLGSSTAPPVSVSGAFPEAVAEILVRLATHCGRLLIAVDDLQWVDPASGDVLVRVSHRVREAPLAIFLSSRTEPPEPRIIERLRDLDPARISWVDLDAFRSDDVDALLRAHLGRAELPESLAPWVAPLSDGTPLGALEVLGALLDSGAVRPHGGIWQFDQAHAERVPLPDGTLQLIDARIAELPLATRRVLELAATVGSTFDDVLVASALSIGVRDLEFALAEARRAGLVELVGSARHKFSHDSVREMLAGGLTIADRQTLHQKIAEALDASAQDDPETLCAAASHYASGHVARSPERVHRAARAAANAALLKFDNDTALRFLDVAASVAASAGVRLDADFFFTRGEASLRTGDYAACNEAFARALALASGGLETATILGRVAWLHQTRSDPERAWDALSRAFDAIGSRMPIESATSAGQTLLHFAQAGVDRIRRTAAPRARSRAEIEQLCLLHYQNARLGVEYNKPFRFIQSTLVARELCSELPGSSAEVRARALYGLLLMTMGRTESADAELTRAQDIASSLGDPTTMALCLQLRSVAVLFTGDFERGLPLTRKCLDEYGAWIEISEYCLGLMNADFVESVRGRTLESWGWIERGIDRVRRGNHHSIPVFTDLLVHRARAALASLGRDLGSDAWLAAHLRADRPSSHLGFLRLLSWGPRARALLESGTLGEELEDLVRAFEAERHNPRTVHPGVGEYYVAIAHARAHHCIRGGLSERRAHLPRLKKAVLDLKAAARMPIFKAHLALLEGTVQWLDGSPAKARKLLDQAENLAREQTCPWVLFGVARVRAHMLREDGKADAARDQARIAELLAREHGAEPRAALVREEFGLAPPVPPQAASQVSTRKRRQLAALLRIVRSRGPMTPEEQAGAVLQDLLVELDAQRGSLSFEPEAGGRGKISVAKERALEGTSVTEHTQELVLKTARDAGHTWPPDTDRPPPDAIQGVDPKRVLATPLFLYDASVGAVSVERGPDAPPFSSDDRELLDLLAHQVPIALEIGRLLVDREELQSSLRQAQKMEAVGQLAGGVAHDFNNMLAVIQTSLSLLGDGGRLDERDASEVALIAQTTERSARLTRQLLSFSRHQPVPLARHDPNELVAEMRPLLERVLGPSISLSLSLGRDVRAVMTDASSLEQCIANLAVNAREAMPSGGALRIETSRVTLDESAVLRGAPRAGSYTCVSVSDTGNGLKPEIVDRIFEPFFTTKSLGGTRGLGLSNVYAFMKNSGGYVDVSSELGRGTTFRLFLAESSETAIASRPPGATASAGKARSRMVLVVDDEPTVAKTTKRLLERDGFEVIVASGASQALDIVAERGDQISVAILDVMMPDMSGPELGRRFADMQLPARLLYMSGYAPESIPEVDRDRFLQKPFSATELLSRVRRLIHG